MERFRRVWLELLSACSLVLILGCSTRTPSEPEPNEVGLSLIFLDRYDIRNATDGLDEPSGLALALEKNALWTISDRTKKIFKLSLNGEMQKEHAFKIPDEGLEDIALDPTGEFMFAVKEEGNKIIKVDVNTREVVDRKALAEMAGYDAIAGYFVNSPSNEGLEGITWDTDTGSIFVVKESSPGLLIELSADLATIRRHVLLNEANGFVDDDAAGDELDFSGICYDRNRKHFWIISDKGRRLFLYDGQRNTAIQSLALGYDMNGVRSEIEKAEGVTIDPSLNRLFVVSDSEARLYVFDLK